MHACGYPDAWPCARACAHVALLIQAANRMCRIVTSFVASLATPHFSTLSHKRHDFRKKFLSIKCVFWVSLQTLFKTFIIIKRIQRDIVRSVKTPSRKLPVILVEFEWILNFLDDFRKKAQISNVIKIRPVGVRMDRRI